MAEETNPAVRGLRLLALLRRGEDLSGLDQAGDIGCYHRRPAAFQHLADQPACGFLLSLHRVPHAEGETSCFTDDAAYLLEAPPPFDERVAEPRQDGVERAGRESEARESMTSKPMCRSPRAAALSAASRTTRSARSIPTTEPVSPTAAAASNATIPVPHPMSRIRSPSFTYASSSKRRAMGS